MNKDLIVGIVIGMVLAYLLIGLIFCTSMLHMCITKTDIIQKHGKAPTIIVGVIAVFCGSFIWPKFI